MCGNLAHDAYNQQKAPTWTGSCSTILDSSSKIYRMKTLCAHGHMLLEYMRAI